MMSRESATAPSAWTAAIDAWFGPALKEFQGLHRYATFARPERVGIEITNACNLNCVMCNTKLSVRPPRIMKGERYRDILRQVAEDIRPEFIELYTIGETFLHPELEEIVAAAQEHGLEVHLSTNAQFPARVRALYERFTETPPKIFLSIDGATKKTFEIIRAGGTFERALETLEVLAELDRGRRGGRIPYYLRSTLSMSNIEELRLYFDVYGPYFPDPRRIGFQLLNGISPDDKNYFREAVPFGNLTYRKPPCHMPFRNLYFTVEGLLTPCARDYNNDLVIGDLAEGRAIKHWTGEAAEALRRRHQGPETGLKSCDACLDTYRLARTACNEYIHAFYRLRPEAPGAALTQGVLDLLRALDEAMPGRDPARLRAVVDDAFGRLQPGAGTPS